MRKASKVSEKHLSRACAVLNLGHVKHLLSLSAVGSVMWY